MQAVLPGEAVIQRGPGEGGQVVESREEEVVVSGKVIGVFEGLRRFGAVSEDEGAVDPDPVPPQVCQCRAIAAAHRVELLLHQPQRVTFQAFEADQHTPAPGPGQRFHKTFVMGRVDAHLRHPADVHRGKRFGQFARQGDGSGKVVVNEEEQLLLGLDLVQFGQDLVHRAATVGLTKEGLDRAELTRKAAAAPGLHQPQRQVVLATEHRPVEPHTVQVTAVTPLVKRLQHPVPRVIDHLGPDCLGLADHHGVGIVGNFVRHQRGMKPAHDNGHPAPTVFRRDLVGAFGGVGLDRNGDEVGGVVEGNGFHPVVVEGGLDLKWRQRLQRRDRQRFHLPGAHVILALAAPDRGVDESDFHATAGRSRWPMIQSQL